MHFKDVETLPKTCGLMTGLERVRGIEKGRDRGKEEEKKANRLGFGQTS